MACPDELTLDLWLAEALPSDEAASVSAHVRTCVVCAAAETAARAFEADMHSALSLDAEELAVVSALNLPRTWRATETNQSPAWGWIALGAAIGGFIAWLAVRPLLDPVVATAFQIGLGPVLLNATLTVVLSGGQAIFDVIRNPALSLAQPLLALLALALLMWPKQLLPQRRTLS
jgi:hypothetical protein